MRLGFGIGLGSGGSPITPALAEVAQSAAVEMPFELVSAAYTPLTESQPRVWFDLQDAASFTLVSTNVTALVNKVSSVSWTPTDGGCPYEATGLNGHPCLHPAAIGDAFFSTEAAVVAAMNTASASKPYTNYLVWLGDSLDAAVYVIGWGNSGVVTADQRGFGQSSASTGRYGQHIINPTTAVVSSTAATDGSAHVLCWHGDATHNFRLDGAAAAPAAAVQSVVGINPNRVALFSQAKQTPNNGGFGRLGELLHFEAEHDSAAIARVNAYLKAKWGTP